MTQVTFRSDMTVDVIDLHGTERMIADAAWVSSRKDSKEVSDAKLKGFIRRLYKDGHGTPFEYPGFTFYFEVPIFVDRQLVKYRLTTINGSSGRYSEVRPEFYIDAPGNPIVQVGKQMEYNMIPGSPEQEEALIYCEKAMATAAWQNYTQLLGMGISKESARKVMPVTAYGSMYFKTNLRNTLNFLAQRMELGKDAAIPSHPQYEITLVADQVAKHVQENFPITWDAFVESGYRKL